MKKLTAVLAALALCLSAVLVSVSAEAQSEVFTLEQNAEDGAEWFGFVVGGESAELENEKGTSAESEEGSTLVSFTVTAAEPGESLILFTYLSSEDHGILARVLVLACVEEDGTLTLQDITELGLLDVTVSEINEEEHTALLVSEALGEIIGTFAEDMAMPAAEEVITIYTDGIMTMSLPPIVNVMGWEAVPRENARA